jgi:hypothetical protein
MTFQSYDAVWWPYLFIFLAGSVSTDVWRFLGVYFAGHIDENAEILVFVRVLATALVAAVIAKLILYPDGALAASAVWLRIGAASTGFAAYFASGKKVYIGVLSAEAVLIGGIMFTSA